MDEYGICSQTLIPLRREASESSEMVSQILFGELYAVIEVRDRWLKIKTDWDNYEGWIDRKTSLSISLSDFNKYRSCNCKVSDKNIEFKFFPESKSLVPIVAGSCLYKLNAVNSKERDVCGNKVVKYALTFINAPYLWGGRTVLGIDCSGLTQILYKLINIKLPRDASQQVNIGEDVNFIAEALPGDLAFFNNAEGNITHVGIIMENNRIIHASGKVRVDKIDQHGIFNEVLDKYTHSLRIIKRVI